MKYHETSITVSSSSKRLTFREVSRNVFNAYSPFLPQQHERMARFASFSATPTVLPPPRHCKTKYENSSAVPRVALQRKNHSPYELPFSKFTNPFLCICIYFELFIYFSFSFFFFFLRACFLQRAPVGSVLVG